MKSSLQSTRQKIIEAAVRLISVAGFKATTSSDLAKEAGISEATIFKYFKDKKALLLEVAGNAVDQTLALYPKKSDIDKLTHYSPREIMRSFMLERFDFIEANIAMVRVIFLEMQYDEQLRSLFEQKMSQLILARFEDIEKYLTQQLGITPSQARGIQRICIGTLASFALQNFFFSVKVDRAIVESEIDDVLDLIEPIWAMRSTAREMQSEHA